MPQGGTEIHNGMIAEWLALEAEKAKGHVQRAFARAARMAFWWPDEAASLMAAGAPLTILPSGGPYREKILGAWLIAPPKYNPPGIPRNFLPMAQADAVL